LLYLMLAWVIQAGAINPITHLVGGGDAFIQGIAAKTFSTSFCPWNPYVQSGKFVFADVLYQSFYPPSLVLLSIFPSTFGFNLFLLIHYALAGLFLYLYLGSLRLTNYLAFTGGLIFMLCGFMTAHKGHEYIISAAVWLPLTLHFIHRYAERLRILDLGYAAAPVALSVLAGFPQITLYSTVLAIGYIFFCFAGSPSMRGWKAKLAHIVFAEFVVLGIGGLLGSLPLFSVAATLPAFTRERITYGMFTSDNFPPLQLLTFLIPNLFGGVDRHIPAYAPDTTVFVAEVYAYFGILPLTLALAGLSAWRTARRELKFWSAAAVIALLMSFGGTTPIYLLLFHVPVYNLFRVPARHLFEVGLAFSIIAAIGLDSLLIPKAGAADPATLARRACALISLLLGIAVLAAGALRSLAKGWLPIIPDSAPVNYLYTFGEVKQAIIRNLSWESPTLVLPLVFFILTVGILFLLARRRLRVAALIAIPTLILADTFFAARRMYDNPSTALMYGSGVRPESDILRVRHFDRDHYRLFPVDFDIGPRARLTSTYHLSTIYPYPLLNVLSALPVINDYGPFWPKRYQAVTGFNAGGGMPIANLQNYQMLSLLGTRYLMVLSPESRRFIEQATLNSETGHGPEKVFSLVAVTPNGITIFENRTVLPRFRFVRRIRPAQDLDDALTLMHRPDFNPAEDAIVEGISAEMPMAAGSILGEKLEATRLHWEVETSGRSFFVAADSFFPGWTATIDGQAAPIYAVDGCVRGIQIQTAGQHRVEMRFVPPGLAAGLACTSGGFLILCLLWWGDRTGHLNRLPIGRHLRSSHPRYKEDAV
jgi:Bacterial membrane protein YfhO